MYFTRQAVTAMEHQPPGSAGMEAIYGIRPIPDDDGVYPYVYNMAAVAGMRVRENGETYVCTRDIDPLLYPPSQVAASVSTLDYRILLLSQTEKPIRTSTKHQK